MKRLHEIDIIRTIAILLVVVTHCFAIYIGEWKHPVSSFENVFVYTKFIKLLSAFRMPAIVLVAGYVYSYMEQKRTENLKDLIIKKFHRLIIPSIIFSIAYVFLFYKDMDTAKKIHRILSGAGHLWFLPMLFWNFLIGFFLIKISIHKLSYKILLVISLFIIAFVSSMFIPNILGISKALSFTVYFYIGIQLYEYRETIIKHLSLNRIFSGFVIFTLIFLLSELVLFKLRPIQTEIIVNAYSIASKLVISLVGVLCFYVLVLYFVEKKNIVPNNIFRNLSKKTYGIYVFHQFILQYVIYDLKLYDKIDYRIAPLVFFVIAIISSLLLTNIFLRLKVGKYLI